MGFNKFTIQVLVRLIFITGSIFGAVWSFFTTDFIMTPIGFSVLTLGQMALLLQYINKTRNELLQFFKSFDFRDFNKTYSEGFWQGSSDELKASFNNVLKTFKQLTLEREEQYQYLKLVNEQVSIGIISYKENGNIDLMNTAAKELLEVSSLGRLNQLNNHDPEFLAQIQSINPGEQAVLTSGKTHKKLAIRLRDFRLAEENYSLISLQDISKELEAQELDAWQKLIRVLTHEIMNSVTPVVSLTTAIKLIMQDEEGGLRKGEFDKEDLEDVFKSISAIEKRGQGLLSFVQAYRDYTRPPEPELAKVNLLNMVLDTIQILKPELEDLKVNVSDSFSEGIFVEADEKLIGQVLINLIKNAKEAMTNENDGAIDISANLLDNQVQLVLADNGPGIPDNIASEIFVPFFTTKSQGNGIGLSLSKQIMLAHNGDITVDTSTDGTAFTLFLNRI